MKKVLLLAVAFLGTTAMVNAQDAAAKPAPAKEVKTVKHSKKTKMVKNGDEKKMESTTKTETKTAKK